MAATTSTPDESASMLQGPEALAPERDRLTTTLFLAALFHGIVILGVTFAIPRAKENRLPTLEVLLATGEDMRAADNLDAQYLAQRNQQGSGTTEDRVRPANPASSLLAVQQDGLPDANGSEFREAVAGQRVNEVISSRSERSEVEFRSGEQTPTQQAEAPLALTQTAPQPIATHATDTTLQLRGLRADGTVEIVPNTRQSILAPYLDAWRRKVERLGTLNFPQTIKQHERTGNPVLEVALQADGTLRQAVIRRSSGSKEVDQAALSILRLASPFDPFPAELRKQYRELRFAYEWQFLDGD
jgi:protein TonB